MQLFRTGWFLVLCAAVSTPALAEEPYYFHKAGVGREAYARDVDYCAGLAGGVRSQDGTTYVYTRNTTPAMIGTAVGLLFASLIAAKEHRRVISRVERTCMGDLGYERRAIDKASRDELRKLDGAPKLDRLFALVASDNPAGKVLVE